MIFNFSEMSMSLLSQVKWTMAKPVLIIAIQDSLTREIEDLIWSEFGIDSSTAVKHLVWILDEAFFMVVSLIKVSWKWLTLLFFKILMIWSTLWQTSLQFLIVTCATLVLTNRLNVTRSSWFRETSPLYIYFYLFNSRINGVSSTI